ncbi:hypothetical protein CCR91_18840 [Thiorhodovibrio winogradskyi]|nr:hypothetical protein [Thiorhodovibrio winogradskyi]
MEDISASMLRLDQRESGASEIETALRGFEEGLERIQVPQGLRKATKDLKKALQEAGKHADRRIALSAYASFTAGLVDWLGTEVRQEKSSLFGRLLGRDGPAATAPAAEQAEETSGETAAEPPRQPDADPATDSATSASPAVADGAEIPSASETPGPTGSARGSQDDETGAEPHATGSAAGVGADGDMPKEGLSDAPPSFNQVLFDLINRLDLPVELAPRAKHISDRLHEPPSLELAGQAVGEIADLMARSRHQVEQEKRDMEQFLSQLMGRLRELEDALGTSLGQRELATAEGSAIDANMSAEVERIQQSVAEAQDISGLKVSIKKHLENIQVQMEARKELEQTQLKLAQAEATHLRESLARVEGESQELRERLTDARQRALHDTLTGLHNRLAYDERIEQEIERWTRYARPAVLSIWDIDYFKRINDTFGHTAGDNALRAVAKLLQESTRKSDFLARFGGEEFMVLFPETDIETALELADRLRERVAGKRFQYRGQPVPLRISCGLAGFVDKDTADEVYRRADIALYRAKAAGRNRCIVFEPEMLNAH